MRFIVIGKDGTDDQALNRRMAARDAHLALGNEMLEKKQALSVTAILNDQGQMCGSIALVDFDSRDDLDAWLKVEPYVTGEVWKDIEVYEAKVAPSFEEFLPQ